MNGLIIGSFGIYLILVGSKGNASQLLKMGQEDAPGFLPWAASIGILAAMYEIPATKKIAEPFIFLVILTFVLRNFKTLKAETVSIFSAANVADKSTNK